MTINQQELRPAQTATPVVEDADFWVYLQPVGLYNVLANRKVTMIACQHPSFLVAINNTLALLLTEQVSQPEPQLRAEGAHSINSKRVSAI